MKRSPTGRNIRVAIIDSGVNPDHPHVGGVAGGIFIGPAGESDLYLDYLGHGTAVAGAIREKAPDAELYAVKVFDRALSTSVDVLLRALDWCIDRKVHVINLSLGTVKQEHHGRFEQVMARATESGVIVVSAGQADGREVLPGCLPSALGVEVDWNCPRDTYYYSEPAFFASGYPRPVPGMPPDRNLNGISFAVANMTGFVTRACELCPGGSSESIREALIVQAALLRSLASR